jgi:hypothetical protein
MATPPLQPPAPNPLRRPLVRMFLVTVICTLSYFLGSYSYTNSTTYSAASSSSSSSLLQDHPPNCFQLNFTTHNHFSPPLHFEPRHTLTLPREPRQNLQLFSFCAKNFTEYCPCQDPSRERQFGIERRFQKERHCPGSPERLRCLVPRPAGYRRPFPWPKSRDYAWFKNVPFPRLTEYKKSQNWVRLQGDRFVFPGGGTSFPKGVKGYVDEIKQVVPLKSGNIRTVLDIGCGVSVTAFFSFLFFAKFSLVPDFFV